jgi:hypothetical protein
MRSVAILTFASAPAATTRRRFGRLAGAVVAALLGGLMVPAGSADADPRYVRYSFANFASGDCLSLARYALTVTCPGTLFATRYDASTGASQVVSQDISWCLTAAEEPWVRDVPCAAGAEQGWRFVPPGFSNQTLVGQVLNQTNMIQNVATGRCLAVISRHVVLEDCSRAFHQLWFINAHVY